MNRIIKINAGGRIFQTYLSTVMKFPDTKFASLFAGRNFDVHPSVDTHEFSNHIGASHNSHSVIPNDISSKPSSTNTDHHSMYKNVTPTEDVFLDVSPVVFEHVLNFLRSSKAVLPTTDLTLRASLVAQLDEWGLLPHIFPSPAAAGDDGEVDESDHNSNSTNATMMVELPDVCVVQVCDHMQHDQGVKRHSMTITYGSDGFRLRELTQSIRRDLNLQLSSTFWQCYQTGERAAFFTTTKVANGAADVLTTSITQSIILHTEQMGYHLVSSYVTLSPDVVHTSVRMLIHNFIFRRTRLELLERGDMEMIQEEEGEDDYGDDGGRGEEVEEEVLETFNNFEKRQVGPQKTVAQKSVPHPGARSTNIW